MTKEINGSVLIKASPKQIWNVLTNNTMITQYLEGMTTACDWHRGSTNDYYIDVNHSKLRIWKGFVTEAIEPYYLEQKTLSTLWNVEDVPENYLTTHYIISPVEGKTLLTIVQKGFSAIAHGENRYQSSVNWWKFVLPKIKSIAERQLKS